ncbi:MAG: hypothetical protein AUK55_14745 [Syntrophobacteraceae bacterium CG2_30_61_12]|nr:MAG: hypothetical protein AUK55_14745 [Syntrophobacteraceae bacterium CG2_30_61_12]
MRIRLRGGQIILVSPRFFWERRTPVLLQIDARKTFPPCHASTGLVLDLLVESAQRQGFRRVLDVGCGCGVFALTAAKLGASLALGVDLDRRAVICAGANARANDLADATHWLQGSIDSLRTPFDCVLANLPRPVLESLWDDLVRLTVVEGRLIVSGFQDIDIHSIQDLVHSRRLRMERQLTRDRSLGEPLPGGGCTWVAMELSKLEPT